MQDFNSLIQRINSVDGHSFDDTCLDVFRFQFEHNPVYHEWCASLGKSKTTVQAIEDIPFLPIEFFKSHEVKSGNWEEELSFESSGTTRVQTSRHRVWSLSYYLEGCRKTFEQTYGDLDDYIILALLPSYLERSGSGLIAMVDDFIHRTSDDDSGYYLNEFEALYEKLLSLKGVGKKVILWGVTFALLDFAEQFQMDFPQLLIMETGGMKGRREEMVRADVHQHLKSAFHVESIHSEYGMTELFSQAYSKGEGLFEPAKTMKVLGRDINDPFQINSSRSTVALNVIDLSNWATCSFIETKDLGSVRSDGQFEVKGRMDNSDIRGCNLLVG